MSDASIGRNEADDALLAGVDAELARWLAVEPSPGFKATVRRRIAAARGARLPRPWTWAAAAAALGAATLAAVILRPPRPGAASPPRPPRAAAMPPAPPPVMSAARPATAPPRPPARPPREAPVLVPAGERRRLEAYYAAMAQAPPASLPAVPPQLTIRPLRVAALGDEPILEEER